MAGQFFKLHFRNVNSKDMLYSYIWFQQMVGAGCPLRAAPAPGKLVCANVPMIRPQQAGLLAACASIQLRTLH